MSAARLAHTCSILHSCNGIHIFALPGFFCTGSIVRGRPNEPSRWVPPRRSTCHCPATCRVKPSQHWEYRPPAGEVQKKESVTLRKNRTFMGRARQGRQRRHNPEYRQCLSQGWSKSVGQPARVADFQAGSPNPRDREHFGCYRSRSSSSTRLPNCSSAVSTGWGRSMSTPASRSKSSGSFEQPPLRKAK